MTVHLPLAGSSLVEALDRARGDAACSEHLQRALRVLERATAVAGVDALGCVEQAFVHLDAYLAALISLAGLSMSCGARCSSCCHDAPVASPLESLRVARVLARRDDAETRLSVAEGHATELRELLMDALLQRGTASLGQDAYRAAHLAFRARDHRCAALDDDGMCVAYDVRPLACRVFGSLDDPDDCRPSSPRFETARRPPLWSGADENRVVELLIAVGRAMGLPHAPNLPWGIAALRGHLLVRG